MGIFRTVKFTYKTCYAFILALCVGTLGFSQGSCDIVVPPVTYICEPGLVTITATGSATDVQWLNTQDRILSKGASHTQNIAQNTTLYVVNKVAFGQELIKNGDFEQGNVEFSSDYYSSCTPGNMPQGAYCIDDNSGLFHAGWSDCRDKQGTGKMLICDGAVVPNENIWCQTINVEQNKSYAFSAWITSVLAIAPPIMQFSINGNLLGQSFQSNNTPCNWQEFFQKWDSGVNTSAEICIVNQSTEGEGNDFGIDNISLREACFSFDTTQVVIIDTIALDLGIDTSFCTGDEKIIRNLLTNEHTNLVYNWSNSETSSEITITQPQEYILKLSTPEGCFATDTITFIDTGIPVNTLPSDSTICFVAHDNAVLMADSALSYLWSDGERSEHAQKFNIHREGHYTVVLSNGENCTIRHQIEIKDECSHNLFIPSSFSPNDDGINDTFGPKSLETYEYTFIIYDRWGGIIYEGKNVHDPWDGTDNGYKVASGVYIYFLRYSVVDLYKNKLKVYTKTGVVTLIR
ncbi:MAG: gliding motility-associated-like protein [Saprospiraceae bacterium]|jgi:gliding motility-associated-like protein